MNDSDFEVVCSKIEKEKDILNYISQEIWKKPEIGYEEIHAHDLLTSVLHQHGFKVEKHYTLPTAFRAEYSSKSGEGATVALLLEYDALPEIGHACGHNLIAEAGLGAALGAKAVLELDQTIKGKIVVLGTPAEEGGGGKVRLINSGAFRDIDAALMVHPFDINQSQPTTLCSLPGQVTFTGKESHAAASPWNGINALDAAVACYQNVSLLRQQIKPTDRINVIITKGGNAANVIPGESSMEFILRSTTMSDLKKLLSRVDACICSAAEATGCTDQRQFLPERTYANLITNEVLITIFKRYSEKLGYTDSDKCKSTERAGSTDMGNVSHVVPSIHPFYAIPTEGINHTTQFTVAAGASTAQGPTLTMAKALALTTVHIMRHTHELEEAKKQFQADLLND